MGTKEELMGKTEKILEALVSLGDSPEAVAEALTAKGIKGNHYGSTCPVANYVKTLKLGVGVGVSAKWLIITEDKPENVLLALIHTESAIPEPVGDFIRAFDTPTNKEKYSHLIL